MDYGKKEVIVSSLFLKTNFKLSTIIKQVNDILLEKCQENKFC